MEQRQMKPIDLLAYAALKYHIASLRGRAWGDDDGFWAVGPKVR